mgnify:CR=1 FL=1
MPRPSKIELLSRFFPEIREKVTKADKEQSIAYNTLACEVVLADLLRLYDKGFSAHGPGTLCVRLHQGAGESSYLALADLRADQEQARAAGESGIESSMKAIVAEIEAEGGAWDPARLFTVPREHEEVQRLEGRYKK